jgi:molybdate transport system substrate-binding protein
MFPTDSHPPIVYPVAVIAGRLTPDVKRFMDFLRSPQSVDIFKRYGFEVR